MYRFLIFANFGTSINKVSFIFFLKVSSLFLVFRVHESEKQKAAVDDKTS